MTITINTDASYSQRLKMGTYAFWITSDAGRVMRSGVLKTSNLNSILLAEMMCILNALHVIANDFKLNDVKKIIINTDSQPAITNFSLAHIPKKSQKPVKHTIVDDLKEQYLNFKLKLYLNNGEIELRHVKAHKHTDTAKHYVNDLCDKECKRLMGILLRKHNLKDTKRFKKHEKNNKS